MAFRSAALTEGAPAGGSLVANTNSGLASGDRILVFVSTDLEGDEADVAISGYTNRGTQSISTPDGHGVVLFERIADGSEGATVTVTGLASSDAAVIFASWSGRHASAACTFITPSTSTGGVEPQTINATGGTAVANDDIAVFVAASPNFGTTDYTWTPPGSYTEQIDPGTHRAWVPVTLATRDNVSSGATGTLSVTVGSPGTTGESVGLLAWVVAIPLGGDVPTVDSLSPADGATGVATTTTLGINFNQNVQVDTGNVRIVEDVAPATAPSLQLRTTDTTGTGDTTSFQIDWTIPGGSFSQDDIIFVAISKDDDDAFTSLGGAGWNTLFDSNSGTATRVAGIWRRFNSGDTTASVTVTGDSESYAARVWLVRGADKNTSPEVSTPATGTSAAADPASLTFSWGTDPTLVLAICGGDGNGSATGFPGGYGNTGTVNSGHTTTGSRSWLGYAELASTTAGSENPGAFTNTNEEWVAATVAFRGAWTRTTVETIAITSGQVSVSSDQVTITPTAGTLQGLKQYHVEIDSGAIKASDDSTPWGGISNFTSWNFTTGVALVAASLLLTQQRARGFPRRAPLPGIALLGKGLLVGIPTTPGAVTGTGSAATSSFDATATGTVTFTGSASAALSSFGADAVGSTPIVIQAPFAQPQPQTRGFGLRYPMPPLPRLGVGVLVPVATAPFFTGGGSAAVSPFAATAVGAETFSGSSSGALSPFAVTATGAITFAGSASAAAQPFGSTASGSETFAGSGSAALAAFACSASGAEQFSCTGSAAASPFAVSASGAESFSGSGSAATQPFGADGTGVSGNALSGSGTAAMQPFAASSSGAETFTGTASAACSSFAVACTGTETFTGSGSAACQPFGASGNAATGDVFTGSGSAALAPFAASSSGSEAFSGSGSAAVAPFGGSASGVETFAGSGSAALSPFACSANGLNLLPITGTASCALSPFGVTASGLHLLPITGSGEAALSPFACTGIGGDNIPIGPFPVVGFTRIAPAFTATEFTAATTRFTATEFDP